MSENQEENAVVKEVVVDMDKNTQLHVAAAKGKVEEIQNEIQGGQKIDAENYLGWTPLMMAARNGHLKAVEILMENRADTTRKNKFGYSVFLMAVASGNMDIIYILLEHLLCGGISRQSIENVLSPLSLAVLFNHNHVLRYLVEKSFNINSITPITGLTPLMFATAMSNCKAYTILTTKHADMSIRNINGYTAANLVRNRQKNVPSPLVITNPQTFLSSCVDHHMPRKSSNVSTPNFYMSPIPPVTPIMPTQVFFPQDFSVSQFASPVGKVFYPNDAFNMRISDFHNHLHTILSPFYYNSPINYPVHLSNNNIH